MGEHLYVPDKSHCRLMKVHNCENTKQGIWLLHDTFPDRQNQVDTKLFKFVI